MATVFSPTDIRKRDFSHHSTKRIYEPFSGWTRPKVETIGKRIAHEYGLDELQDLFQNAALTIWTPHKLPSELTDLEKRAIRYAPKKRFWDQPWPLKTTYFMLFVAAVVQGWGQTGINAANLNWPLTFNIVQNSAEECYPPSYAAWKIAGVNAVPWLAASIGCWFSDPLNELFLGRRPAIMISAMLIIASAIGSALSEYWYQLLGCRVLLGIGMGFKASVVPVFAAEIAPDHLRGSLVMNWQIFDALGIFLGFAANLIAAYSIGQKEVLWRWQLASLCIPAFALLCGTCFICWDSPRFLMKHEKENQEAHRYRQSRLDSEIPLLKRPFVYLADIFRASKSLPYRSPAFDTLCLIRGEQILAAVELVFTHCQILVENSAKMNDRENGTTDDDIMAPDDYSLNSKSKWFRRMRKGLTTPHIRREARAAAIVMLTQQLCGINVLILYSANLFCQKDASTDLASRIPLWLSFGIGLTNFVFALPSYRWIEIHGRRWLLLTTLPLLVLTLAVATGISGSKTLAPESIQIGVAVFTFLFTVFYSFGVGPVPFAYSAEIFPLEQRMIGMSWAVSINFFWAGLLTLAVPVIIGSELGATGLLGIFVGLNFVALVLVWRYVPEVVGAAKGNDRNNRETVNLEGMFYIFDQSMGEYRNYNWSEYRPYIFQLWLSWIQGGPAPNMPKGYVEWLDDATSRLEQELERRSRVNY